MKVNKKMIEYASDLRKTERGKRKFREIMDVCQNTNTSCQEASDYLFEEAYHIPIGDLMDCFKSMAIGAGMGALYLNNQSPTEYILSTLGGVVVGGVVSAFMSGAGIPYRCVSEYSVRRNEYFSSLEDTCQETERETPPTL